MLGGPESLLRLPPRNRAATLAKGSETFVNTVTGSSQNLSVLTNADAIPATGCYVTWIFETDVYFNVYDGRSGSGDTPVAASAANSEFVPAGVYNDWWHPQEANSFSVIQKTTGGGVYRHRSNP